MIQAGSYLAGLGVGLSLIMAIGAQNAFVLKQGLLRNHVFAVCLFCATSDAALIAAGVAGAGAIARNAPWFLQAMRWGGAAFLLWYGLRSARAAWRGGEALQASAGAAPASLGPQRRRMTASHRTCNCTRSRYNGLRFHSRRKPRYSWQHIRKRSKPWPSAATFTSCTRNRSKPSTSRSSSCKTRFASCAIARP